jgi:YD repeat-containing protein
MEYKDLINHGLLVLLILAAIPATALDDHAFSSPTVEVTASGVPDLANWTDDLSQWVIDGIAKVKTSLGGVPETNPPTGYDSFIFVSNGNGPHSSMSMEFEIPAGTPPIRLVMHYQFVSDEFPRPTSATNFYDVAELTLDTPAGQTQTILHQESRNPQNNGLSWPTLSRLFGFSDPDLPSTNNKVGGTGWHPVGHTIDPATDGTGTYRLTLTVSDAGSGGDAIDSAFLLAIVSSLDLEKNLGCAQDMHGNPCNAATGNKFQAETDYEGRGPFPLRFTRFYNSLAEREGFLGAKWQSNLERRLVADSDTLETITQAELIRANGRVDTFQYDRDTERFLPDPDVQADLTLNSNTDGTVLGWHYTENDHEEEYDAAGRLTRETTRTGLTQSYTYDGNRLTGVSDHFGRTLTFTYHPDGLLASLTGPDGNRYEYRYANNLLQRVTLAATEPPGDALEGTYREYHYEDSQFPQLLTGITDENTNRYATWRYNADGLVTSSEHAGGSDQTRFEYLTGNQTRITNAKGDERLHTYAVMHGIKKLTRIDANIPGVGPVHARFSYHADGYLENQRDFAGTVHHFEYDPDRGLEVLRTEAQGSPAERTITTEWHPNFRVPLMITEPKKITTFTYDDHGRRLTRQETNR